MASSYFPQIPPPLVIEEPDAARWDDSADLIVVGFGGTGAATAIQALELGGDVLAVERFGGGGATHFSGGINYAAGTRHQKAAGYDDSPEEMFKYLKAEGSAVSDETLRRFCEGSNADMEWLERHGVPYGDKLFKGKTAYPPDGYDIYFSGNEKSPKYAAVAKPAPRGHKPVTPGFAGHLHYSRLLESARDLGLRLMPHAPAMRLIVDGTGAVIGVEVKAIPESLRPAHEKLYARISPWRPLNQRRAERAIAQCRALEDSVTATRRLRATRGVVLSTGGYIYNLDKLAGQRPELARNYEALLRLGSMGCDGSGIELGVSAGGATDLMDKVLLGRNISPPEAYVFSLMVNCEGQRFVNEDAYLSVVGDALAAQSKDGTAWLVLDAGLFRQALKQSFFPGKGMFLLYGAPALLNLAMSGTKRAGSLAALARKCGVDPAGLEATVAGFNQALASGSPDPLGKAEDKMRGLGAGPYYAVNVSLHNKFAPTFTFTLGGLVVDEASGLVRRADGSAIPGLYAAGRAAVGLCSQSYMSGLSIADTVFSGRRAARWAMGNGG
jgi:3-oxo-5alpha-steroid 4-dehydrogenase